MLPAIWALRDVDDVEGLCRGVLTEVGRRSAVLDQLSDADYDESLSFLLERVVVRRP